MLAGVCGGLGRYFDVNPAFYRVGFVVLALLGGAGILIYVAALLVIPNEGEDDSIASEALRNHRQHPWALIALALVAVAGIVLLSTSRPLRQRRPGWSRSSWAGRSSGRNAAGSGGVRPRTTTPAAVPPVYQPVQPPARAACSRSARRPGRRRRRARILAATGVDVPGDRLRRAAVASGRGRAGAVTGSASAVSPRRVLLAVAAIVAPHPPHLDDGIGDRNYHPLVRRASSATTGSASASSRSTSADAAAPAPARHAARGATSASATSRSSSRATSRCTSTRPRRLRRGRRLRLAPTTSTATSLTTRAWSARATAQLVDRRPRRRRADRGGPRRTMIAMPLPRSAAATTTASSPASARASRRRSDVDPTLVRLVFALLALAGGAGIVLYVAALALHAAARAGSRSSRCSSALGLVLARARALERTSAWRSCWSPAGSR